MKPYRFCMRWPGMPLPTEDTPFIGNGAGCVSSFMEGASPEWWNNLKAAWAHAGLPTRSIADGTAVKPDFKRAYGMPMGLLRDKLNRAAQDLGLLED